ncbi:EAL domain-containing protein [Sinorhizobium meliloti]|nr:EAL domain-containing protein [Sinorhizobium meliloti]
MYPEMPRAISRSTMDVETDDKSQTIVRGILALAHGLGMRVTAEGVETADARSRSADGNGIEGSRSQPVCYLTRHVHVLF